MVGGNISGNLSAPGANTQVVFNDSGTANATANLTFNKTTGALTATGTITGGNISTAGTLSVGGSTIITGNLTVNGTTEYTNVTNLAIKDPIIGIGRGANNAALLSNDGFDRGEQLWYFSTAEKSAFIGYDNSAGKLIAAQEVSITNEEVIVSGYGSFVVGQLEGATVSVTGNVTGGNIRTAGLVSATGSVTASQFNGSGAGLSSIPGGNVTGTVASATTATSATSATSATTAGTVTTAAQPNITSLGALTSLIIPVASSDPGSPATGQFYYNTFTGSLRVWTGSAWDNIA